MSAGASFASPCGAPMSTHFRIVSMSACFRDLSFVKCPKSGLANQGGIFLELTAFLIAFAHGRADSYVSNDIGAVCPGLWQLWQFFWKIGSTSFVKVGSLAASADGNAKTLITKRNA